MDGVAAKSKRRKEDRIVSIAVVLLIEVGEMRDDDETPRKQTMQRHPRKVRRKQRFDDAGRCTFGQRQR